MVKKGVLFLCGSMIYIFSAILWMYGILYFRILSVSYLMKQYMRNDSLLRRFSLTENELSGLTGELVRIMKGKLNGSGFTIETQNGRELFLNEKELCHLKEIAGLLQRCNGVMLAGAALLSVVLLILWKRGKLWALACGVYGGILLLLACGGILTALSYRNLSAWIDGFHKIFFKGWNWVLNPAKDRLIYLCPNSLFRQAISTILIGMGIYFVCSLIAATTYMVFRKKTMQKKSSG